MAQAADSSTGDSWNALRSLLRFAIFVFIVACLLVVAAITVLIVNNQGNSATALVPMLTMGLSSLWTAVSPLFQLFVVLVLIEWFMKRIGLGSISTNVFKGLEWNTQTIIAVIVIGSFAAAALGGLTVGLGALKDVALVVVGFYFGTQRRVLEVETEKGKIRQVIEHDNPAIVRDVKPAGMTPPETPDKGSAASGISTDENKDTDS